MQKLAYGDFIDQLDAALTTPGLPGRQWQQQDGVPEQGVPEQDRKLNNAVAALREAVKGMPADVQPQVNALLKQFLDGIGVAAQRYRQRNPQSKAQPAAASPQPAPTQAWVIGNCKFAQMQ